MIKIKEARPDKYGIYGNHLKALPTEDKYTRFGYPVRDSGIDEIILNMLYKLHDHYLFIAYRGDEVAGFGHLAREGDDWELAVSVNKDSQGQGVGNQLIAYMIDWGKTRGIHSVFMHCISENTKIQHLAKKHGLRTVERDAGEITAKVDLPAATPLDYTADFVREQRELANKIIGLQQQMLRNLNPLAYIKEHQVD